MYNEKTKKRKIACILIICILSSVVFFCHMYLTSDKILKEETVNIVKELCEIDIENMNFEYDNTLKRFHIGGDLKVQFTVDEEIAKKMTNHYMNEWADTDDEREEMVPYLLNDFGISKNEINGKLKYLGRRRVRNFPRWTLVFGRIGKAMSYLYLHENMDGTITFYISYQE